MHLSKPLFMAAGLAVVVLAACTDTPTRPVLPGEPDNPEDGDSSGILPHGVLEITLSGIGGSAGEMSAHAEMETAALDTIPGSDGTIQLEAVSTGSFTEGARGEGGLRYLYATFRVRNADAAGAAYSTPRQNLTFLGFGSGLHETSVVSLRRFDGSAADAAMALDLVPSGAVQQDASHVLRPRYPDVLQVYDEAEVAAIDHPSPERILPWGFVVRNSGDPHDRTLPANPAEDQWDGVVTFAFRIPLQATAADDPFTISMRFLAIDDPETRITQSPEEQTAEAWTEIEALAAGLGATEITVLAGSSGSGGTVQRRCEVRTAGTEASPTRYLHDVPGPLYDFQLILPGETADACESEWKSGAPSNLGLGVEYPVTIRALDRYGNLLDRNDELALSSGDPDVVLPATATLAAGTATVDAIFRTYGQWDVEADGAATTGTDAVTVAGIHRQWIGETSTDWSNALNWDYGVIPATRDSVTIDAGSTYQPVLTEAVSIGGITVNDGVTVAIGSFDLSATTGDAVTNGTGEITGSSGWVRLQGPDAVVRGRLPRIVVSGTYTADGMLILKSPARATGGRLRTDGYLIRVEP